MKKRFSFSFAFAAATLAAGHAVVGGCSSNDTSAPADASTGNDSAIDVSVGDHQIVPPPKLEHVAFRYTPSWKGAQTVSVVGGFNLTGDWNALLPLVGLTDDGTGTFNGTVDLPAGDYLFLFRVVGDPAAASPTTFVRYALDPASADAFPCPKQSPTYDVKTPNPCSRLTVPRPAAGPMFHVRGTVLVDAQPASGYLVVVERAESMSHPFFEDRATTGPDGAFDLVVAAGNHRLQVLHPTFLAQTDAMRDPIAAAALRRVVSSVFTVAADVTVPPSELGYHDYAFFAPRDAGPLPTRFVFADAGDGGETGAPLRLNVYGTVNHGAGPNVVDPWFSSPTTTSGAAIFDGGFNTMQAAEPGVVAQERYFWGIESAPIGDGGVSWTGQSMVFPITWH